MLQDLSLKIALNNILWSTGCYTRMEVKLAGYNPDKRAPLELTDLDVLGIRFNSELAAEYTVADCTSNKAILASPLHRALWLKGVMALFGAPRGFLSLGVTDLNQIAQRSIAANLGVTILDENNLRQLEKRLVQPDVTNLKLSAIESWSYLEDNLAKLPKMMEPLSQFRKYRYWMMPAHEHLHGITSLVSRHAKHFEPAQKFQRALVLDLLTLFTLSVLTMVNHVLRVNAENAEREMRAYFFGGYAEMRRREAMAANLRRLSELLPKQGALFEKEAAHEQFSLEPAYMPKLFDVAFRFLNKPYDACQIPRYMQMLLFERVLYDGTNEPGVNFLTQKFSDVTRKLARDLATFFCEATRLPEPMIEEINAA